MKQLLDVRWLTNHRLLRSKPFLSAAREQLSNQVQATLERSCRSTTKVNADRLHASASDFQGQLSRSENCDDLIRAYRLLHRWIQVLPSELESSEQVHTSTWLNTHKLVVAVLKMWWRESVWESMLCSLPRLSLGALGCLLTGRAKPCLIWCLFHTSGTPDLCF